VWDRRGLRLRGAGRRGAFDLVAVRRATDAPWRGWREGRLDVPLCDPLHDQSRGEPEVDALARRIDWR
jgi:hypothetical protein